MSRLVALAVLSCGLFALAAEVEPKQKVGDWLLFRRTPEQTGFTKAKAPEKLDVLWKFTTGDSIESAVAVADGVVFAASMDEHLYAIDLDTGKQKWKYKAGPFKAPPSVRNKLVYVGDLDGYLHCVDAAKGEKKWTFEAGGTEIGGANFHEGNVLFGSHDENLYSVSGMGKENWKFKIDGPIYGSVSVSQGKTFLAGCDSQLHVIDVKTGKADRSVDLGGQSAATAAVMGDVLYVGTMKNEVKAIDWKKGDEVWTYKGGRNTQAFYSSPAVSAQYVVIGNRDNRVHCIDRRTGKGVWRFVTENKVDGSPVIAGSHVVVGSLDAKLYVIDLEKGKEVASLALDGAISASPVVLDGKILIGTQKGTVYCLGKKK
jgi:outer membrane protein assembly factor BamB